MRSRRSLHRPASPAGLLAALVTSARMRGLLHGAKAFAHAAAIRAGDQVGLVTLTLDARVVWFPDAISQPHAAARRVDLTDLTIGDALAVVFARRQAA
jgi:hypothetical protein